MNLRTINMNKAKNLLSTIDNGCYTIGSYRIEYGNIPEAEYYPFDSKLNLDENPGNVETQTINRSVIDVIHYEYSHNKDKVIGVLNFASARHPGGGFIRGAIAQEEALCQASTLYTQLKDHPMYNYNNANCADGKYNDNMIVTKTKFVRDSRFEFIRKPSEAIVVTSAAVNLKTIENIDDNEIESIMYNRMEKIIKLFAIYNCNIIILGAFGCGVFRNDPYTIANIWRDLLNRYGGYFDKVDFAVTGKPGSANLEAFNTFNEN